MMKKAFTLAEVLITIGIVGVIAAVTLPAIKANIDKTVLEKQTVKFYTQMKKAVDLYKVDNELDEIDGDFDPEAFVKKYFNITGPCENAAECYADKYDAIDRKGTSTKGSEIYDKDYSYKLQDGTNFSMYRPDDAKDKPLHVLFDVNGLKGPNVVGYDLQYFIIYNDGSIDDYDLGPEVRKDKTATEINKVVKKGFESCKKGGYGGCFGHLMRNNFKFDY